MPNNEDEWIDEVAAEFRSDTLTGYHAYKNKPIKLNEYQVEIEKRLKATIKDKLLEARINEAQRVFNPNPHSGGYIGSKSNDGHVRTIQERIAELQASAPTKKGEDHHGGWRNNEVWLTEEQAEPFRDIEKLL